MSMSNPFQHTVGEGRAYASLQDFGRIEGAAGQRWRATLLLAHPRFSDPAPSMLKLVRNNIASNLQHWNLTSLGMLSSKHIRDEQILPRWINFPLFYWLVFFSRRFTLILLPVYGEFSDITATEFILSLTFKIIITI